MSQQSQSDSRSLYHRWRSRSFSEVVGQDHVTRTLRNAVAGGRIVHAYLFCGPRGTGKTSTARILAKAVNCLNPQDGEPCNSCPSCRSVSEGRALDLIEIDAASNRGIDDARDLREKIKYSPGESRYKVYIIDEAHMLTSEASNALLKTLEEPPEHAILILATTESHKILATISSRCQRFDFRRIPLSIIIDQLKMICDKEGIRVDTGVLDRVARMARGSLRDAESLLDQLVAYCGVDLDLASAREVLGLTGEEAIPEFAEALRLGDLVRGFQLIDNASSTGADLRHFSRELVDHLRALMVLRSGADTSLAREMQSGEAEELRTSAKAWDAHQLLIALKIFGDLEGRLRQEAFSQLHLEVAFMEAVLAATGEAGKQQAQVESLAPQIRQPAPLSPTPRQETTGVGDTVKSPLGVRTPPLVQPAGRDGVQRDAELVVEEDGEDVDQEEARPPEPAQIGDAGSPPDLDLPAIRREWPRVAGKLQTEATFLFIDPKGWNPLSVSGTTVTFGIERAGLRKTMEKTPALREKAEESLSNLFGVKVAVKFEYGVKLSREAVPPERDAVVEAAVKEFGFQISRIEPVSE